MHLSFPTRRFSPALLTTVLLTIAACERSSLTAPETGSGELVVRVVSGDAQSGPVNAELRRPIVIQALDKKGKPIKDQVLNFRAVQGGGSVFAGASSTNKDGMAQDYWTLGPEVGPNRLEVRAVDPATGEKLVFAIFTATATPPAVATITLTPSVLTIEEFGSDRLDPTLYDASGNVMTPRPLTWTSSNPAIVGVQPDGVLLALAKGGPVTITATVDGVSGQARVTVVPPVIHYILVNPPEADLTVGERVALQGIAFGDAQREILGQTFRYVSSNTAVATVSGDGVVVAVSPGVATVVVTVDGSAPSAEVFVRVTMPTASITLTPASQTLFVGRTGIIQADVRDAAGNVTPDRRISWTSSDPSSVWVEGRAQFGDLWASLPGQVTITASVDGLSATATVTVLEIPPDPYEPNESPELAPFVGDVFDNGVERSIQAWRHTDGDIDWYRVRVRETNQVCVTGEPDRYTMTVHLSGIPYGFDYDLEVRREYPTNTGVLGREYHNADEHVVIPIEGSCGAADDHDVWIQVRIPFNSSWYSHASEMPYTLSVKFQKH